MGDDNVWLKLHSDASDWFVESPSPLFLMFAKTFSGLLIRWTLSRCSSEVCLYLLILWKKTASCESIWAFTHTQTDGCPSALRFPLDTQQAWCWSPKLPQRMQCHGFACVCRPPGGEASRWGAAKGRWAELVAASETSCEVRCEEAPILAPSTGSATFNSHSALLGAGRCQRINGLKMALLTWQMKSFALKSPFSRIVCT